MTVEKSRLIYTAGTFAIDGDLPRCRRLLIRSEILRLPNTTNYFNDKSNPPKFFLGYVSFFIGDYVSQIIALEFLEQAIYLWDNPAFQLFETLLCTNFNINENIVKLGAAVTPPALLIPVVPPIATFSGCPITKLKFKLMFGTRIQVIAVGEELVECPGISPEATIPTPDPPVSRYPEDRAREDDPARSLPELGDLPGDTAPATVDDPDLSLRASPITVRTLYSRDATPGFPSLGNVTVDYEVPNASYVPTLIAGTAPGACPSVQPQTSVARSPGNADIVLAVHNTCNLLTILSYTYL